MHKLILVLSLLTSTLLSFTQTIEVTEADPQSFNITVSDFTSLEDFSVESESYLVFSGDEVDIQISALDKKGNTSTANGMYTFQINGKKEVITLLEGKGNVKLVPEGDEIKVTYIKTAQKIDHF